MGFPPHMPAPGICQVKGCHRLTSANTVKYQGKTLRVCAVCYQVIMKMLGEKLKTDGN